MHEALALDRDESHNLVSAWIAELDPAQARAAVDAMALVVHALAEAADFDLDRWLRELGMAFAQPGVPS